MWTTIDEEGNEHLTKVHQSDCNGQEFSDKTKQFMCNKFGGFCSESCIYYSGLRDFINDYEKKPTVGIEIDLSMVWEKPDNISTRSFASVDDNSDLIDDDGLLDYLQTEIWP